MLQKTALIASVTSVKSSSKFWYAQPCYCFLAFDFLAMVHSCYLCVMLMSQVCNCKYACRGRLRTIMVTGDHPLTAVATAQVTGMLNYRRKHIILTSEAEYKCGKPEHLLSASSLGSTVNLPTQSLESFGRSLCTKSAMPYDRAAVAGNVTGISTRSASRSKSLSTAEFADKLTNEPRSRLSSRPLVVKPAVPSSIPKSQDGSVSGAAYSSQRGPVFIQQHLQATRQIATYTVEAGFSQFTPVQTEPASNPFVHTSSSDSYFFDTVATRTHLPLSNSITPCQTNMRGTASDSLASLSFALAEEGQIAPMAGSDAVDLIAQGHQCIITGSVFDCLLQHAEPALLKAVLCNVAVCACMGPQQKAQLVQLLGSHGLTLSSTRNFKVGIWAFHVSVKPCGKMHIWFLEVTPVYL